VSGWQPIEDPSTGELLFVKSDAPLLPPGWKARTDQKTGKVTYFNSETGETSENAPPNLHKRRRKTRESRDRQKTEETGPQDMRETEEMGEISERAPAPGEGRPEKDFRKKRKASDPQPPSHGTHKKSEIVAVGNQSKQHSKASGVQAKRTSRKSAKSGQDLNVSLFVADRDFALDFISTDADITSDLGDITAEPKEKFKASESCKLIERYRWMNYDYKYEGEQHADAVHSSLNMDDVHLPAPRKSISPKPIQRESQLSRSVQSEPQEKDMELEVRQASRSPKEESKKARLRRRVYLDASFWAKPPGAKEGFFKEDYRVLVPGLISTNVMLNTSQQMLKRPLGEQGSSKASRRLEDALRHAAAPYKESLQRVPSAPGKLQGEQNGKAVGKEGAKDVLKALALGKRPTKFVKPP